MWRLFTSVEFAVLQIIDLAVMATVGIVIRQLPGFALRAGAGSSDYISEMDKIHARYDAAFGSGIVGILERAQVFRVFSSVWFSAALVVLLVSIVICTLDRLPRIWRQSRDVRVVQPEPFFDPRLPDRARISGVGPSEAGAIPAATISSAESWRWVVDGGWATIVWTLPSDAVRSGIVRASMNARPASRPPASSNASMPPGAASCRRATSCCGWLARPG